MNIKQAREQIKIAMRAYFSKDMFGGYRIPIEKQRPIFLMGPPGIGKTAIMEQIAQELGVGLVSYSMTHHTRQSALGLPFIEHKTYGGREYAVSEYTMSEIIASVYDMMEKTGLREGILFLDEVNCVSETLAPSMLQFLQFKIFGRHRVPDGWIVVTAGNPPEYNSSVREFDIVTWDRLKRIDVEPDYEVWKEYAYARSTHPAILTYLDIRKSDFYRIESSTEGKTFVTARGWSDLSEMMRICEENGDQVDENMILQYVQNKNIAKDFAVYYDLFNKYRSDYQVDRILDGNADEQIRERAEKAKFDERLSLLGLLLDGAGEHLRAVCQEEGAIAELLSMLKTVRMELVKPGAEAAEVLQSHIDSARRELVNGRQASNLTPDRQSAINRAVSFLEEERAALLKKRPEGGNAAFKHLKADYDRRTKELKKQAEEAGRKLSNLFRFAEDVFPEGQELLILVTELTISIYGARFISHYGCKEYFAHNKELLFYERQKDIITEMAKLDEMEL
ncbi:MAG: AAA family ATPase [Oscillospiraceae bacterium]|nr:AAA family ATPase [Oscillospiraceae bacterium]